MVIRTSATIKKMAVQNANLHLSEMQFRALDEIVGADPNLIQIATSAYMQLALQLDRCDVPLTPNLILTEIPGMVLCILVESKLIKPPPPPTLKSEAVELGDGIDRYYVDPTYRDALLEILASPISYWKIQLLEDLDQIEMETEPKKFLAHLESTQSRTVTSHRNYIREWQDDNDKTLEDLEESSGMSIATISRIKNGIGRPRPGSLKAVAKAIGIGSSNWMKLRGAPNETVQ